MRMKTREQLGAIAVAIMMAGLSAGCPKPDKAAIPATRPEGRSVAKHVEDNTGLPMRLVLPEGAHGEDFDMLPPSLGQGRVNWQTAFHYDAGFPLLVAEFDAQLAGQGYSRISGPDSDFDVNFTAESSKPSRAEGKKVWISADRRILVFLTYTFVRATETAPERNDYVLSVLKQDTPYEVKEPQNIVPIPSS